MGVHAVTEEDKNYFLHNKFRNVKLDSIIYFSNLYLMVLLLKEICNISSISFCYTRVTDIFESGQAAEAERYTTEVPQEMNDKELLLNRKTACSPPKKMSIEFLEQIHAKW